MTEQPQIQVALPPAGTRMNASDYFSLPETMTRIELIHGHVIYPFGSITKGEVVVHPPPTINHQRLVRAFYEHISDLADEGETLFAPVAFHLSDEHVVEPDVVWIAPDSTCEEVDGKHFKGAPDLVVEILSPGTATHDRTTKFALYEHHGVREYWLADEKTRSADVWQRIGDKLVHLGTFGEDDTFESLTLGKTVTLKTVFAVLD